MTTKTSARTYLWLLAPLVPLALLLAWYVWLPPLLLVLLVRHLRKPEGQKVTERNWAKARHDEHQHRVKTLIQMHLAANGLPNTPENRAWAITALNRGRSRRSGMGRFR
jgi:hypothetical protein